MDDQIKFHIWSNASEDIPGGNAEVLIYGDPNDREYIEFVKESLTETFKKLWDERHVMIMTDAEINNGPPDPEY